MAELFDLDVRTVEFAAALDRGTRSGLGIGLFDHGGFVVDGGSAGDGVPPPVIARQQFPTEWRVLLVFDRDRQGPYGETEIEKFAALLEFPEADAAELCRLVLMCALPGVVQADLDTFGDAVGRIQARVGDHFADVQGGRFASPGCEPGAGVAGLAWGQGRSDRAPGAPPASRSARAMRPRIDSRRRRRPGSGASSG